MTEFVNRVPITAAKSSILGIVAPLNEENLALESLNNGVTISPYGSDDVPARRQSEELAVAVVAFVEGWMVLLEMAVEAVDGLGTCVFYVDVDVTFRGRPLFRSGATGEVSMSLKGVKAEVW
ncbi:hypothetical protein TNCV_811731 [Trichonephila clavipes]|nr:hypothetical protein TNCV_811731 [Trichonephila clavipes]